MADVSANWRAWATPVAAAACVIAFAAGSSSVPEVSRGAHDLRWWVLGALCVTAIASIHQRRLAPVIRFLPFPGSLLGLALLSTTWSPDPWLTFRRSCSLGLLFLTAAALAQATFRDELLRRRVLIGLALGAVAVAVLGFVLLVVSPTAAAQASSDTTPWRYRGFGENPNTVPVLAAVALPIIVWRAVETRGLRRVSWITGAASLLATAIATESRGGLVSAFLGLAIVLAVLVEGRGAKVAAIAVSAALCWGGVVVRTVEQSTLQSTIAAGSTTTTATTTTTTSVETTPLGTIKPGKGGAPPIKKSGRVRPVLGHATQLPQREDEIGDPIFPEYMPSVAGSGRVAAWEGALSQVAQRPILGYGFGTESQVFVDRWYVFQGGAPENSVIGILLMLGAAGLAVLLAIAIALTHRGIVKVRHSRGEDRAIAAIGLAVIAAGGGLMMIQSYVYSVGNIGTTTFWIVLFLLADVAYGNSHETTHAR